MTDGLVGLALGIVVGILAVVWLTRLTIESQVEADLVAWRSRELYAVRHEALDKARPDAQRRVGLAIAGWTHAFPFLQEDTRFLGHPVDYVVFEGYSQVRARREHQIACVTFFRVRRDGRADPEGTLVEDCVRLGNVGWVTLVMPEQPKAPLEQAKAR